ncbi:MAG: hypothetical protein K0S23_1067 [Fluviicola sp.]|jgi:hypothetical protein|uniref:hypothetical protein n=1 Tax=Fluviicola sp. TaxID=1917219 RepID=UPI002620CE0A|nr:hypothetical protein [Fluviicola sp.]MDF3026760.1 hypothetical protein [Fluviicola sp.]
MDQIYKNFYQHFYLRTGGFLPTKPLNQNLFPGDYFQIINGEIVLLGNLYRKEIIDPKKVKLSTAITLNATSWNFSDGVSKPYSGRWSGQGAVTGEFEFSKQVLKFANKGSFCFRAKEPVSIKMSNWNDIQQELIIKLTHSLFSFRELYIVTESATATSTTLAIAGESDAELELATEQENFGLVDIFGCPSTKTIQSKDIEYYHCETRRKPAYFKAKKLMVQEEKLSAFVSNFMVNSSNPSEWVDQFFNTTFHHEVDYSSSIDSRNAQGVFLDMLHASELNSDTALLYYKWADTNLDDVEKLFGN